MKNFTFACNNLYNTFTSFLQKLLMRTKSCFAPISFPIPILSFPSFKLNFL